MCIDLGVEGMDGYEGNRLVWG